MTTKPDVPARIEALPEMVGEPNLGGWSLVERRAVLAILRDVAATSAREEPTGLREALMALLAQPTTDIRTLNARTLFDKAVRSATQEVTITAQQLRVLLPAIEAEAVSQVIRAALSRDTAEPEAAAEPDLTARAGREGLREVIDMVAARAHRLGCRPDGGTPVTDWRHCPNSACREVASALAARLKGEKP